MRDITVEVRLTYDADANAAYLYLKCPIDDGAAVRQEVVDAAGDGGEVILDFDHSGRLLGLEMLGATALLPASLLSQLGSDATSSGAID